MTADSEQSSAVAAIEDVARRYVGALDERDTVLLRTCYHPGAFEDHNEYQGDVEGFCEHLLASRATTESTKQTIAEIVVRVDGSTAECRTTCQAVIRTRATEERPRRKQITVDLEYADHLELRDGVWASLRRVCVPGTVHSVEDLGPE